MTQPLEKSDMQWRRYDRMTYRDIEWKLRYQQMPEPLIEKTLEAIKAFRAERTRIKRQKREADLRWTELIFPLQHERKIIRAMRRYKTVEPTPERDEFLEAYALALDKVLDRMKQIRHSTKGVIAPVGDHWTDYVPEKVKDTLRDAALDIPPRHKAKFKEPFTRTTPLSLNSKRKGRVLRKANAELDTVETLLQINPKDARLIEQGNKLRRAIYLLQNMPPDYAVPNTWHGVLGAGDDDE